MFHFEFFLILFFYRSGFVFLLLEDHIVLLSHVETISLQLSVLFFFFILKRQELIRDTIFIF
jgi:hypothetical protein